MTLDLPIPLHVDDSLPIHLRHMEVTLTVESVPGVKFIDFLQKLTRHTTYV